MIADELRRRLGGLRDGSFRQVAVMRMEGYSNAEIAGHLGTTLRGVERKLAAIRKRWQEQDGDQP